ncbi:hypothetical protein K2P47_01565 [Patescibacteria group bacterium]|nr:hypothetical protein [Patescibacteria group bacterium]
MNNKFPNLNLKKFSHSYSTFFDAANHVLKNAYINNTLLHILPEKIGKQYRYSEYSRNHLGLISFLESSYILREDQEGFVSFLNEIIPEVLNLFQRQQYELDNINNKLSETLLDFIELVISTNDAEVFDLDFYYDNKDRLFKRKLDVVTAEVINQNTSDLDTDSANKLRYEECVAEFLAFRHDGQSNKNLFYNQSLDKLKRIVENTLERLYAKEDGSFPKLSNKKQISNILFDGEHPDFENRIGYVVSNIHHEQGGQPKKFTEKEYVYLWLELNQILYLLNRYKK